MFGLDLVPEVAYRDPWVKPFATRLRQLATGRHRVAYFYERPDNSTFRYRIYNMAQVLNETPREISASFFFLEDAAQFDEIATLADQLVICRTRYDHLVVRLITAFRTRGKKVLYDTDDLVFNVEYAHLLMSTLDVDQQDAREWDHWFAYTSRLGATLRLCDGGIGTNDWLATQIAEFAQIPTAVIPNFMNREQVELSKRLFEMKRSLPLGNDGLIHFGYFSGSPSHNRDFAMVTPALEALLDEDDSLGVIVVGYIEPGPQLSRFGKHRVKRMPFQDYLNLQRLIASVEFNLMPLQYNVFTNCKSELKYFEAAAVGTPSVASPTNSYRGAIRHGVNGWLAQAHQWLTTLRGALAQRSEYSAICKQANEDVIATYTWQVQRPAIVSALGLASA